jgi:hypothetical protein
MSNLNDKYANLRRQRNSMLMGLLLLVVLVSSLSAVTSVRAAPPPPLPGPIDLQNANLSFAVHIEASKTMKIDVNLQKIPKTVATVQFQISLWFTSKNSQTQTLFYTSNDTESVHGDNAKAQFKAAYQGDGEYFVQLVAINANDGSVIANVQGDPFDHIGFSATLSSDDQSLIISVWKSHIDGKVKTVNFQLSGSYQKNGAAFVNFYPNPDPNSYTTCSAKQQGGTATCVYSVPFQGDGNYFFELYAYNAADNSLLGVTLGDPRQGTGG